MIRPLLLLLPPPSTDLHAKLCLVNSDRRPALSAESNSGPSRRNKLNETFV